MLMVFMVGSGMLFLSLSAFSVVYVYGAKFSLSQYPFPKAFVLSTIILLFNGILFYKARENFETAHFRSMQRYLWMVFFGSTVFIAFQSAGWWQVIEYTNTAQSKNLLSFVFALSGIHALHVLGGLIFLIWMIVSVRKALKDGVEALVFSTEPYTKARLATLSLYWLYLEVIWVMQFLLFYLIYW